MVLRQSDSVPRTAKERKVAAHKQEVARLKRVLKDHEATYMKRAAILCDHRKTQLVKRIERAESSLSEALAQKDA